MKEKDLTIQGTKSLTKKAKEQKEIAVKDKNTALVKSKSVATKKATTSKKEATTKKNSTTKKATTKKSTTLATKTKKTATTSKTAAKKVSTSKKTTTSATKTKKSTTTKATRKSSAKKADITAHANEYFDLPYRYNETIVKLLAQTPKRLFVYWDISNKDRENYIKSFGEEFFNQTIPFLRITNETQNYTFDVEINDFANSWYININDDNCVYSIELYRKFREYVINNSTEVSNISDTPIFIAASNKIDAPNGKSLETYPRTIMYINIKTNELSYKEINSQEFYNMFFTDENGEMLKNPSSSSSM